MLTFVYMIFFKAAEVVEAQTKTIKATSAKLIIMILVILPSNHVVLRSSDTGAQKLAIMINAKFLVMITLHKGYSPN